MLLSVLMSLCLARVSALSDIILVISLLASFIYTSTYSRSRFSIGETKPIFLIFFAFFLLYFIMTLSNPFLKGLWHTTSIALSFMAFLILFNLGKRSSLNLLVAYIVLIISFVSYVFLVTFDMASKNVVSAFITYLVFFSGLIFYSNSPQNSDKIVITTTTIIFLVSFSLGHRMIYIGIIALILSYSFLYIFKARIFRSFLLLLYVLLVLFFMALTIGVFEHNFFEFLIKEYSGRTSKSGRQILWPELIQYWLQYPWFGLGAHIVPSDLINTKLSSHNLFIQVLIQTGLVGFFFLTSIFYLLYKMICDRSHYGATNIENLMLAFFLFVLVHSSTEVFLIQNTLAIGILVWMIFGYGLGILSKTRANSD